MKGETVMISVVTPSYNQGEFIEETIQSVLSQEGDFTIDYLVIDGGSTDGSGETIRRYAEYIDRGEWPIRCRGLRFRWISEQDKGQADALVKGFGMAEGEILAWLNSDDVYLPGALQAASELLRNRPEIALVYGDAYNCDTHGNIVGRYGVEEFDLNKLAYLNYICQPSSFFRRYAFEEVGGLDRSLHYGMDYDLFVKLGKKYPCAYLPQVLSSFRLHDSSKTMRDDVLYDNLRETVLLTKKHFNWAPVNRVFGLSHAYCVSSLPHILRQSKPALLLATSLVTVCRYLQLNRGLRRADLKLLNSTNFSKVFQDRAEVLKGQ